MLINIKKRSSLSNSEMREEQNQEAKFRSLLRDNVRNQNMRNIKY